MSALATMAWPSAAEARSRKMLRMFSVLTLLACAASVTAAESKPDTIIRKPLLTAQIPGEKPVSRVEIKEINFAPGQRTGAHLHPSPVVGYIATGAVVFQVDGQAPQTLRAGDAFYEPANTKIVRFDALDQPTKFIAYYLLGKDDHELIRPLQ